MNNKHHIGIFAPPIISFLRRTKQEIPLYHHLFLANILKTKLNVDAYLSTSWKGKALPAQLTPFCPVRNPWHGFVTTLSWCSSSSNSQSLTSCVDQNWHYCGERYCILLPMAELFKPLSELNFKHVNPLIDERFMLENPIKAGGRSSSVGFLCTDWRKLHSLRVKKDEIKRPPLGGTLHVRYEKCKAGRDSIVNNYGYYQSGQNASSKFKILVWDRRQVTQRRVHSINFQVGMTQRSKQLNYF